MPDKNKLGVGLFVYSESQFFLILIAAYVYYHVQPEHGPSAANSLHPGITGAYSVALFASSATMAWAHRQFRQSRSASFLIWLGITIVLGAVFLYGQASEYHGLINHDLTVSTNQFGATFFTLTGFHGLHVFLGLVLLSITFWLALSGQLTTRHASGLSAVSIYWHFVDAVWVFIFGIVYIWPLV